MERPIGSKNISMFLLNRKKKYVLGPDEEFVDYKYVQQNDGSIKRKKIIKRITRMTKELTQE